MMRNGRILAFACVASIGLAACGGGSSKSNGALPAVPAAATTTTAPKTAATPRAALLRAVASTEAAKTAKTSMTITATGLGVPIDITASGAVDFATGDSELTMELGALGGSSVETRIVDGVSYTRLGSTGWKSVDLKHAGLDPSSLSQSQSNPNQYLSYLAGVSDDVKTVGHGNVRGVDTTHYHATIDMGRALQRTDIPASLRDTLESLAPGLASVKMSTDVWIDNEGRARKMTTTIPLAGLFKGSPLASSIPADAGETATVEFYDFGTPLVVVAPPANEVTPLEGPRGG